MAVGLGAVLGALFGVSFGLSVGGDVGGIIGAFGGTILGAFLGWLWEERYEEVVVGAVFGAIFGAVVGWFIGGVVGAIIGLLVWAIFGAFLGWLLEEGDMGVVVGVFLGTILGELVGVFIGGGHVRAIIGAAVGGIFGAFLGWLWEVELYGVVVSAVYGAIFGAIVGWFVGGNVGAIIGLLLASAIFGGVLGLLLEVELYGGVVGAVLGAIFGAIVGWFVGGNPGAIIGLLVWEIFVVVLVLVVVWYGARKKKEIKETKKIWKRWRQRLTEYSEVLKGSGVIVKIPSGMPDKYKDLKASIGEMEKEILRVKSIADEYKKLKERAENCRKEIEAMRMKLVKTGIPVPEMGSMELEYLRRRLPEVEKEIEEAKKILAEYELLGKRWKEYVQELTRYREVLKGTGVIVRIPSVMPDKYEDLKASIAEMEREIARVESIADDYKRLKERAENCRKEIEAMRMKLDKTGIPVPEIGSMELEYLSKRLPEVEKDIDKAKKKLAEYELLSKKWGECLQDLRRYSAWYSEEVLNGRAVRVKIPSEMPTNYEDLKASIGEMEREIEWMKRNADAYEKLKERAEMCRKEIEAMRTRLDKTGIAVPEIGSMELEYLRKRLPEVEKEIEEAKKRLAEYELLSKKWDALAMKLQRAGVVVSQKPESYVDLKEALGKLEERTEKLKAGIAVQFRGDLVVNEWCKGEIEVRNAGEINVEDVEIKVESDVVEIKGIKTIAMLKPGEEKKIPVRIMSRDAGYVPVEAKIRYKNMLSEMVEEKSVVPEIYVKKEEREAVAVPQPAPQPWEEITLEDIRRELGRDYDIIKPIATGKYGYVIEARRKTSKDKDERVALKVMRRWNREWSKKFIDEVKKWEDVWAKNNEDIVRINNRFAAPFGYIEMDLLKPLMNEKIPMDWEDASRVMRYIARALYTAHKMKTPMYHMDVKPQNILLDNQGRAKLGDWGLAQRKKEMSKEELGGTLPFASPEVLRGEEVDARSDMFSWGATFYYLLTGKYPFPGKDENEIYEKIVGKCEAVPLSQHVPSIPKEIEDIVMRCLKKRKSERFRDMGEVFIELSSILNEELTLPVGSSTMLRMDLSCTKIEGALERRKEGDYNVVKKEIEELLKYQSVLSDASLSAEFSSCLTELGKIGENGFRFGNIDNFRNRLLSVMEELKEKLLRKEFAV